MTNLPDPVGSRGDLGRTRVWYLHVASTMEVAASLAAAGAPHGTVVEAGHQSAGRGRMGRSWETRPGEALLTSWILRIAGIDRNSSVLSPLFALALIRTVAVLAPEAPVGFKWPNDVLVDGRKLAGILLTSRAAGAETVVIAGIGVNVFQSEPIGSDERASLVEWRDDITVTRAREALAGELSSIWDYFMENRTISNAERQELEAYMAWRGEIVEVQGSDGTVAGAMIGLEPDGALRMRGMDDNQAIVLHAGEIVRGPRKMTQNRADSYRILP